MRKFDEHAFQEIASSKVNEDLSYWPKYPTTEVEIGAGVGLHPIRRSLANKNHLIIAIEKTATRFNKFRRRYVNHGSPENLLLVHAHAISWITQNLKKAEVDRYFILYPNPYPKKRDLNKRWYAMPFMSKLVETLKIGGEIVVATNISNYYLESKKWMQLNWGLELVDDKKITSSTGPLTHFEKKYLERGETCYHLTFRKITK